MVARLKLEENDGRAPPGEKRQVSLKPQFALLLTAARKSQWCCIAPSLKLGMEFNG